jgi:hypothetical protein
VGGGTTTKRRGLLLAPCSKLTLSLSPRPPLFLSLSPLSLLLLLLPPPPLLLTFLTRIELVDRNREVRLWKLGRLWGRLKSFTAIEIDRKAAIVKRFFARVQNAHVLRSFETLIRCV